MYLVGVLGPGPKWSCGSTQAKTLPGLFLYGIAMGRRVVDDAGVSSGVCSCVGVFGGVSGGLSGPESESENLLRGRLTSVSKLVFCVRILWVTRGEGGMATVRLLF